MRFGLLAVLALLLSGCNSPGEAERLLLSSRWSNSLEGCGTNYMSFANNQVAYHHRNKVWPIFTVKGQVVTSKHDQNMVYVSLQPTSAVRKTAAKSSDASRRVSLITIGFEVSRDRLRAAYATSGEVTKVLHRTNTAFNMFNLMRCPHDGLQSV